MVTLDFYDVKARKKFRTDKFKIVIKNTKRGKKKFAIARSPITGIEAYRLVANDFRQ